MKSKLIKIFLICFILTTLLTGCAGIGLSDNVEINNESIQEMPDGYVYTAQVTNNNDVNVTVYYNVIIFDENEIQLGTQTIYEKILANTTANVGCGFNIAPGSVSNYQISNIDVQYDF